MLEFLIVYQDWFMLDIPPAPVSSSPLSPTVQRDETHHDDIDDDMSGVIVYSSDEENDGWRLVERRGRQGRKPQLGRLGTNRRTASASERSSGPSSPLTPLAVSPRRDYIGGLVEGDMEELPTTPVSPGVGVTRSRTMPTRPGARRGGGGVSTGEDRRRSVLKKGRSGRVNVAPRKDGPG